MSDFDSFIKAQLNEYGVIDSLAASAKHKLGAPGTKLAAKFGSKTAKGKLSLRDTHKELVDAFKFYCGEQQINLNDVFAEDVVDFLINKMEFHIEDPVLFTYQQPQDEAMLNKAKAVEGQVHDDMTDEVLDQLADLVRASAAGDVTARYGLWFIYRNSKPAQQVLRQQKDAVGKRANMSWITAFLERAAKIRLKRMTGQGPSRSAGKAAAAGNSQPTMATDDNGKIDWNADQGDVEPVELYGGRKGWKHEAFDDDGIFAKSGLRNLKVMAQELYGYSVDNKSAALFAQKEQELTHRLQPPMKGYQIARMLMEFYAPIFMEPRLENICATLNKDKSQVTGILEAIQREMRRGTYDSNWVVKQLMRAFPNQTVSKLVMALMMGLCREYDGDMGDGGSGPEAN